MCNIGQIRSVRHFAKKLQKNYSMPSSLIVSKTMTEDVLLCTACVAFTAIFFVIFKFGLKGRQAKNDDTELTEKKETHLNGFSAYQNQFNIDKFNYHKVLNEFHNTCSNCSNVFSSMKCIQLASSYPELINMRMFPDGVTPFHRICFRGNIPVIEFMLAKGADPEIKTSAGENALCMALYYYLYSEDKDLICLNILSKHGCRFSCDDEWYEIFLNLAIKNNNKKLTEWMIAHSKFPKNNKYCTRASSVPISFRNQGFADDLHV